MPVVRAQAEPTLPRQQQRKFVVKRLYDYQWLVVGIGVPVLENPHRIVPWAQLGRSRTNPS